MEIIPAIYISKGKTVALYKGGREHMDTYSISPLEAARQFADQGAPQILISDIDGVEAKGLIQQDIIKEIIDTINLPTIVEAGTHKVEEAQQLLNLGASQIAVRSPSLNFLKDLLAKMNPDKLIVIIFAARAELIEERKKLRPDDFTDVVDYAEQLIPLGIKQVIYKDRRSEGTLIHPNYDEIDRLYLTVGKNLSIYSSGGISDARHIKLLKKIGASGAIIGKAFYEKKITLQQALSAASRAP